MAKYFGKIGFAENVEVRPGVWKPQITEREYYGDVMRVTRRLENASQVNDNVNLSQEIDIVADQFAYQSFHAMRYVEYMGAKWKVTSVEVYYPRLKLHLGGVWNGEE